MLAGISLRVQCHEYVDQSIIGDLHLAALLLGVRDSPDKRVSSGDGADFQ